MSGRMLWGIDLGGSKIEGVVLRSKTDPQVLCRERVATQGEKGYAHVLNQIKTLIQTLADDVGMRPTRLGVGIPGRIEPVTGLVTGCNAQSLNGKPMDQDLEKLLDMPVAMENDANCFVLAETKMGIVAEIEPVANVVFGVILGTGVGGGVVVQGRLIVGKQSIAGDWGHNFLHESGGPCFCGRNGCVETVISGTGLEKYYASLTGQHRSLKQIVALAQTGERSASSTLDRLITFFGLGIGSIINIIDPDVIVIGGGVGKIDLLYTRGVNEVGKHIFTKHMKTSIVKPKLGDSAGVFGAAFLFESVPT